MFPDPSYWMSKPMTTFFQTMNSLVAMLFQWSLSFKGWVALSWFLYMMFLRTLCQVGNLVLQSLKWQTLQRQHPSNKLLGSLSQWVRSSKTHSLLPTMTNSFIMCFFVILANQDHIPLDDGQFNCDLSSRPHAQMKGKCWNDGHLHFWLIT